ncbi:MAG: class I SAM-dependent methyltransferase [Usitatibacteraceae bacterium]
MEYNDNPYSTETLERYLKLRKPYHAIEYFYKVMGDLKGKRILDVGCGPGDTSLIFAAHGAEVLAVDLSSKAIEAAKRRAAKHSFPGTIRFECAPLETFIEGTHDQFDIVCGHSILHHLLPVLGEFLEQCKRLSHDGTQYVFIEPIATSEALRNLRLKLGFGIHGTDDERPLNQGDLAIIKQHIPDMEVRYFEFANRITKFLLSGNYEKASPLRRGLYDLGGRFDRVLLHSLGVNALGSVAVLDTAVSRPQALKARAAGAR